MSDNSARRLATVTKLSSFAVRSVAESGTLELQLFFTRA